jgi:hypothetical protein
MRRLVRVPAIAAIVACLALIGCGDAEATSPQQVADQIAQNDVALREAIDSWRAAGDPPSSTPPQEGGATSSTIAGERGCPAL